MRPAVTLDDVEFKEVLRRRRMVRRFDGRIWVVSQEGQGSSFTFELPLAESDQSRLEEMEAAGAS